MKNAEIDLNVFLKLPFSERAKFVESKLQTAGFDRKKKIVSIVDSENMKYTYMQED